MKACPIQTLTWNPPGTWLCWPPTDVRAARSEAASLVSGTYLLALTAAVDAFQEIIEREIPGTAAAALWVPDETTREPLATAVLRVTSADPGGRWSLKETLDFAHSSASPMRGAKLLNAEVAPARTVAGDAVLRTVDSVRRVTRRVSREWTLYILPPGTDETLLLQAQSSHVAFFDEITESLADIARTVAVTLESP